jgi:hypothetical protein
MTRISALLLFLVLLSAGCVASTPPPGPPGPGTVFRGEVWTWDEKAGTVTLRQDDNQMVRVRISPDQLRALTLHQTTTVTGELAPAEIETVTVATGPVTPVPRGPVDQMEIAGTVAGVDPSGKLTISSARGPVELWVPAGVDQRFRTGSVVRVRMSVQAVDMVSATSAPPSPAPSAAVSNEPGDYAVVTGRVVRVDPGGTITVESPKGPVQLLVSDAARYRPGQSVQARTSVHPGQ